MVRGSEVVRWTTTYGACLIAAAALAGCSSTSSNESSPPTHHDAGVTHDAGTLAQDGGIARQSTGCGQGTSCTAGSDLAAPATTDGFQILTPPGGITVQPGQEQFLCYYRTVPNTATVDIGKFQSWMTPGSSHHFIAFGLGGASTGQLGFAFPTQPDGTLQSCAFGGGTWMYATSLPGEIIEMKMPDGVGLPLASGTQIMLNMHFINPSSSPANPQVKLNVVYAQNVIEHAAAMISFNRNINVPAATSGSPGKQTVSGTCQAPAGSKFFAITTHTHKRGVSTLVNLVRGGQTTNLADTTDWEHPDVALWDGPDFLTTMAGDSFSYSCSYVNNDTFAVTVGDTAATNEMCMAIGYYFPAGSAYCN